MFEKAVAIKAARSRPDARERRRQHKSMLDSVMRDGKLGRARPQDPSGEQYNDAVRERARSNEQEQADLEVPDLDSTRAPTVFEITWR